MESFWYILLRSMCDKDLIMIEIERSYLEQDIAECYLISILFVSYVSILEWRIFFFSSSDTLLEFCNLIETP